MTNQNRPDFWVFWSPPDDDAADSHAASKQVERFDRLTSARKFAAVQIAWGASCVEIRFDGPDGEEVAL